MRACGVGEKGTKESRRTGERGRGLPARAGDPGEFSRNGTNGSNERARERERERKRDRAYVRGRMEQRMGENRKRVIHRTETESKSLVR